MHGRQIQGTSDKVFDGINYFFLTLLLIVILYPLIFIISSSFSSPAAVTSNRVWLYPVEFSLKGYAAVFENKQVWSGYANSFYYAAVGTVVNLAVTIMAAYPLARKNAIYGRGAFMFLFLFTMLFSGGLVPNYLVVKNLHLLDSRWALILPSAMSVWNMIITKTYFQSTIPEELYEASELDGCGDFRILIQIVLPLSGTIIAVNALFYAVAHWNAYFNALLYLKSARLFPLQIVLRNILIINQVDASMISDVKDLIEREGLKDLLKYSLIIVASLPVLIFYPFLQKYFVKGVMIGSVKG